MKRKKILFVCNRVFWPPMNGHEVAIYNYCIGLHEKYGYEIDTYIFDQKSNIEKAPKPNFLNDVFISANIGDIKKISNLISKSFLSREKLPLQCSLFYSKNNEQRIRELVQKNKYYAVFVDMIRLAPYYDSICGSECKKVFYMEDVLSKRYKRQIKAMDSNTNVAGAYHKKLPVFIQKILSSVFIKKLVLKLEIKRTEKAEKYYSELYDKVVFVSEIETEEFNRKYSTDKAVTVSLGVDYGYYSQNLNVSKISNRAVFVGNIATPANADSIRMIVKDILPLCKSLKSFVCIGKCPEEIIDEFKGAEKISFTGMVDDLRPYAEEGTVFLAPLAYGTGIKTKILEAMAMGLPVVTNSIGAEGIWAENGKHWIVSDDPKVIAQTVDELMDSQDKCDEIGENAKSFIQENFQWDIIFEQFKKLGL